MSILICSASYNGCGFIGHSSEFPGGGEDVVLCPSCNKDKTSQLTKENLLRTTYEWNRELAHLILTDDDSVVSKANCGCVHHAEEGKVCVHDIHLARKNFSWQGPSGPMSAEEQAEFDRGLGEFFDILDGKVADGSMTLEQAERFFPDEVKERNKQI